MHKPVSIKELCFSYPNNICFENFSTQVFFNDRIAIIGNNGSGKSTFLKILLQKIEQTSGTISLDQSIVFGYVPQIVKEADNLSGGQRFNASLTKALTKNPNFLLLDEPTNHLDQHNRNALMRMLQNYYGTLIIVSHDQELLSKCINKIWHIEDGQINIFQGNYNNYLEKISAQRNHLIQEVNDLKKQEKRTHSLLMKEQQRGAKSKSRGHKKVDNRKWPTNVSKAKMGRGITTSVNKKAKIRNTKEDLLHKLSSIYLPEKIVPSFSIEPQKTGIGSLLQIRNGSIGYQEHPIILKDIDLDVSTVDRIAITGRNGSGKSTLLKSILGLDNIKTKGHWSLPKKDDIGYLDQHYKNLEQNKTVYETISDVVPCWNNEKIRNHLNNFLFKKNQAVNSFVSQLSGGEKARLSLAIISAKTPKLLILDEVTNNLDLGTTNHIINVLKEYPGAFIVISHEKAFLDAININTFYETSTTLIEININNY